MTEIISRWWYLDLAAEFPELEIYTGHGWGPEQETGQLELGERVMTEEALWLVTWIYSRPSDRHWAAVSRMFAMIIERIRRDRPETELAMRALAGEDPEEISEHEIPPGWLPDVQAWNAGKFRGED
jgi:hypothetical protein